MDISIDSKNRQLSEMLQRHKRNILVFLVYIFPIVFTAIVFLIVVVVGGITFPEKVTHKGAFGEISSPASHSVIGKSFTISGNTKDILPTQSVYLIENREARFWPKHNLGNEEKDWSINLDSYAKKGQITTYILVKVEPDGAAILEDWFKTSHETGEYPGFRDINFAIPFAKIKVKSND